MWQIQGEPVSSFSIIFHGVVLRLTGRGSSAPREC